MAITLDLGRHLLEVRTMTSRRETAAAAQTAVS